MEDTSVAGTFFTGGAAPAPLFAGGGEAGREAAGDPEVDGEEGGAETLGGDETLGGAENDRGGSELLITSDDREEVSNLGDAVLELDDGGGESTLRAGGGVERVSMRGAACVPWL